MKMKANRILICILIGISVTTCKKDKSTLSEVETYVPVFIASKSATIGCYVSSDGGSKILDCGLYIGIASSPETNGTKLEMGNDTGFYLGRLSGLSPATMYYLKAYAINGNGESLGDEVTFTTPAMVEDYDANSYQTVKIGNQVWMAENLKTTHFLNGDPISTTTPATLDITSEGSPQYQWSYDGSEANNSVYGKLYTWYVVSDQRKVCPDGWHVPGDTEWSALETALGGYLIAGARLKEEGNDHWQSPYNLDATNESCFSALPGGYRDRNGTFSVLKNDGYWWSATESETDKSWSRMLSTGTYSVARPGITKSNGLSVRCIKN